MTAGTAPAWLINENALIIATTVSGLLIIYSRYLKSTPLLGNLAVAFISGLAFIYGGIATESLKAVVWAAGLAFLFHLAREIIKDIEDDGGDAVYKAGTLPVKFGIMAGRTAATIAFILLLVLLPLPYYFGSFSAVYLWIAMIGITPIILGSILAIWRTASAPHLHLLNNILKGDMIIGIIALILGRP